MPIYEYVCGKCGEEFEHLTRADEKPTCPACGDEKKLARQMSAPSAHTKGAAPGCAAKEAGMCDVPNAGGCGGCCGMG
jgi:putative FmdB family regulatory protein